MTLKIIVATDRQGGIGIGNQLPWRLPEDLANFKQVTMGHPVIMGRKTFESIGRVLPGRRNIVITRNHSWQHDRVECIHSLQEAVALTSSEQAFIIGGAEIYQQAFALCTQIIKTEIDNDFACDAFFPVIDPHEWTQTTRVTHYSDQNACHYAFVTYQRI
jgi:dihydrofolate reductase